MVSQSCPRCTSERVRRGYRPTPLWSKIIFRINLLCDDCNWEFMGFAIPGTVGTKPTKRIRKLKNTGPPKHPDVVRMNRDAENTQKNSGVSIPEINNKPDEVQGNGEEKEKTHDASSNKNAKKKESKSSFEQ